ncbi:calcium-transporting ATPase 4, plasma membrane-type isoform 1 [Hibiscus syriacus]|uniref:Calcium-transporting ATPase 4, plasma membrane-type isoform 1 n=1 Tax=Hibiscus syriacus TaxID=106335 RepID=A0A6A2WI48_HIBSY|nr:pentatricopeptide repeat-containing protein At3g12770-like [Hibiscus syriacus]KAE8658458.1 calcium-transporting ATPase 4, plasma membrane-type isoform 1 [Hibiscus syriacus]
MAALPSSIHKHILLPKENEGYISFNKPKVHYRPHFQKLRAVVNKLDFAHQVFDEIPQPKTYAWNQLIQTHLSNKHPRNALSVYHGMMLRGICPDNHTLPRILTASRLCFDLAFGKQVHAHVFKHGFSSDVYVITALIQLYGCLHGVETAKWVLDNAPTSSSVALTILAKLYLADNKPHSAIEVFNRMIRSKAEIDPVALATAAGTCSRLKSIQQARNVHKIAKECGLEFHLLVSNSLMKMYIDCDSLEEAQSLFDAMLSRDIISWTEMIRGLVKNGGYNEAVKLFRLMNRAGIKPDSLTITSVLPACARVPGHKQGKELHAYLLRNGLDMNLIVQNALMDMYVKSGFIELASNVFMSMIERDIFSWTIIISGYSLHGQGRRGLDLFSEMEKNSSLEIDEFAYAAVLHACVTSCNVNVGMSYFNHIKKPTVTHCLLMVALLARAGLFNKMRNFIEEHRIEHTADILRAVLDGCRIHRQETMGKRITEQLCELEPLNAENYVLLSNWYAESAKWDMVEKLKTTIKDMGLEPKSAYSWIEFRNKVHVFGTGDVSHPRSEMIYWELQHLMKKMEDEGGHEPNSEFSLHDVDEERECIRIGHCEMLAISLGLISTQERVTVRVTKNLRVCRSCHDFAKGISKIVDREIIIKDPNCFHHFKNGHCSCGDLW